MESIFDALHKEETKQESFILKYAELKMEFERESIGNQMFIEVPFFTFKPILNIEIICESKDGNLVSQTINLRESAWRLFTLKTFGNQKVNISFEELQKEPKEYDEYLPWKAFMGAKGRNETKYLEYLDPNFDWKNKSYELDNKYDAEFRVRGQFDKNGDHKVKVILTIATIFFEKNNYSEIMFNDGSSFTTQNFDKIPFKVEKTVTDQILEQIEK